jgi:hypothetical protein
VPVIQIHFELKKYVDKSDLGKKKFWPTKLLRGLREKDVVANEEK